MKSKTAVSLKEYVESGIEDKLFSNDDECYFWKTESKVSYNKNGIVSVRAIESWFAGGVCNEMGYGSNYSLKTAKKLTIHDVISGDAKDKILKEAKKYCGFDTTAYNVIKDTKNYKFYLTDGKVHICYGSYELQHGNVTDEFSILGKYK